MLGRDYARPRTSLHVQHGERHDFRLFDRCAGEPDPETPNGISARTGTGPTDLALAPGDRFLFVLNLKSRTIGAYAIKAGGSLSQVRGARGLPATALGLAAMASE